MSRSIHPMSHDQGRPGDIAGSESTSARKLPLFDRDPFAVRRLCWALAGTAVVIALLVLAATTFGPAERAASYASGATPAVADEVVREARRNDTGYFPDQFVVEHWDESPMPEQF